MRASWERYLERWMESGLLGPEAAARIRAYEAEREKTQGLRWPVLLAIGFGGLLLGAGVLLFVAAHWDRISPAVRFGLALLLVGFFHIAGAVVGERFAVLSCALHALGTVCLGAGIFLTGQTFHLQEHWPGGVMLWALGAWVGWLLLRDWPQIVLVGLLTPMWLGSEWIEAARGWIGHYRILAEGLLLLAISYFTAVLPGKETTERRALELTGGFAVIPLVLAVIESSAFFNQNSGLLPGSYRVLGWTVAMGLPLLLAWWWRRGASWMNFVAALWVIVLGTTSFPARELGKSPFLTAWQDLGPYVMCAIGSFGLAAWGLKEARKDRVNLGVAGFALTVLFFYFSTVMDKLGRSASLIGLGLLFLVGGWLLEKTRRRLVAPLMGGKS